MFDGSRSESRVYQNVTATAAHVDNPAHGPDPIDAAPRACITASRPVASWGAVTDTHLKRTPLAPDKRTLPDAAAAFKADVLKASPSS